MEIDKRLLYRKLHILAIEQLKEEYSNKGYNVISDAKIGAFEADLFATKDEEKIIIEVKTGRMTPQRKKRLAEIADYVSTLDGYQFKVVVATPPREKIIEISGLDEVIYNAFANNLPSELDSLSTHTTIDSVMDVEVHNLLMHNGNQVNIMGQGVVEVGFRFGSSADERKGDGYSKYESFPFDFDFYLSYNEKGDMYISEVNTLEVNTDSYYE